MVRSSSSVERPRICTMAWFTRNSSPSSDMSAMPIGACSNALAEPLLRFAQFGFGVPAVGEVARARPRCLRPTGRRPGWCSTASTVRHPPSAWFMRNSTRSPASGSDVATSNACSAIARSSGWMRSNTFGADERIEVESEDALGRGARVREVAPVVDDRHDVARVAHHRAEASLVPLEELGDLVHGASRPGARPASCRRSPSTTTPSSAESTRMVSDS